MAGVTLGFLKYVLGLDTLSFRKGMTEAERDLVKLQKSFEKRGQAMIGLGKSLSIGFTAPLAAFAAKGIKEAQETAAAMAQVNASLASMGPIAGRTGAQLQAMADKLETESLYEADQVLKDVTAQMLTFGNVTGKTFDRAQQATLDLATKFQKDLGSATILVGKALNDPIKGLAALSRVGVQFTAQQKEQIKAMVEAGNAAGAQGLILAELERQVRGSAVAAQNADPWNKLSDAFNQMAEKVGTALLPLIPPLTDAIISVANAFTSLSPQTQKWVLILAGVAAALGPTLIGLGGLLTVIAKIGPLVLALSNAWKVLAGVMALTRVMAVGLLPALVPFLVPLAAIAVAVGAVYLAWKNWDKITAFVIRAWNAVKTFVSDNMIPILAAAVPPIAAVVAVFKNWDQIVAIVGRMVTGVQNWLNKLKPNFDQTKERIREVKDAFRSMYDKVVGNSYVPDMVDEIGAQMARLDAVMVAPVKAATSKAAEAFRDLQQQTKGLLDRLFPEAANLNTFRSELATLEAAMKRGILTAEQYAAALGRLQTEGFEPNKIEVADTGPIEVGSGDVVGDIEGALNRIPDAAARANEALMNVAQQGINSLADGLTAVIMGTANLGDVFKQVAAQIIADLIRIQIQKLLMDTLGSALGLPGMGSFGGGLASGGPVSSNKWYVVGEKGPELFAPGRSGRIISNDNIGGGDGGWGGDMHFHFPRGVGQQEARMSGLQASRAANSHLAYGIRGRR